MQILEKGVQKKPKSDQMAAESAAVVEPME